MDPQGPGPDADAAALRAALARCRDELAAHRHALAQELHTARRLQAALLPRVPRSDRFECAVLDRPAEVVGGDTYDVHLTAEGRLRVFVADTTGHGVEAALRTMIVRTVLDRYRTVRVAPGELLGLVNDDVVAAFPGLDMRFAAACLDVDLAADPDGGARADYADAALPPLLHLRAGRVEEVARGGTFVGLVAGARFETHEVALAPGDRLALHTDGLDELFAPDGARVPEATVRAALASPSPPWEALADLGARLDAFRGARPQDDDVTVLLVEFRGGDRSWISRW